MLKAALCIAAFAFVSNAEDTNIQKGSVVLIHGIMDSPFIMWKIEKNLREIGYEILNFDYASTKWPMDTVIAKLHSEIQRSCDDSDQIYFVVHSLGGLVIRAYLNHYFTGKEKRLVMIAAPNRGSILAERLENIAVFKWLLGEPGQLLGKDEDDYFAKYPIPRIPFGIISGGLKNKTGFSPLIPGDDDWVVGVEETKLEGASDFIVIPGQHTTLLWQSEVIKQVILFLRDEKFDHTK